MSSVTITPRRFSGTVRVPASKSHTIRQLLIASLADGVSHIRYPLDSLDTRACLETCRAFGANIEVKPDVWIVTGNSGFTQGTRNNEQGTVGRKKCVVSNQRLKQDDNLADEELFTVNCSLLTEIDVGNSGTTLYLALAIAGLQPHPITFTGDESIKRRSAAPLLEALSALGVSVESKNGCAPITIKGPWRGGKCTLPCPTSQYLSALLIAAPLAPAGTVTEIEVPLLNERPYVEMTLSYLDKQGIKYEADFYQGTGDRGQGTWVREQGAEDRGQGAGSSSDVSNHCFEQHDNISNNSPSSPVPCPSSLASPDPAARFKIMGGQSYKSLDNLYDANNTQTNEPVPCSLFPVTCSVPADFSSAAFPAAAAAITGGSVTLLGLDPNDTQGDKYFLKILEEMGCKVEWKEERKKKNEKKVGDRGQGTGDRVSVREQNLEQHDKITNNSPLSPVPCPSSLVSQDSNPYSVTVSRNKELRPGTFDLNETPDLLPAAAAVAAYANGDTKLVNVAHARIKETDRIAVMAQELAKLGVKCTELPDGLIIHGRGGLFVGDSQLFPSAPCSLPPAPCNGHDDHRIVMAFAVAALGSPVPITITTAESASVTYPGFFEMLENC